MQPPISTILASPAARVTLLMCFVYAALGVTMPYLGRWFASERGLTGAEIGLVLSSAQIARIVIGPLIGAWGDSVADRRTPIRVLTIGSLIMLAGLFFLAHDFAILLAFGFAAQTLYQTLSSFIEASTLRATTTGAINYGFARGLGSLAFIAANITGGVLIAKFGLGSVVVLVLALYAIAALTTLIGLPADPAPPRDPAHVGRFGALAAVLRNRRFVLALFACSLINSSHQFFYGFSTLVWRDQGIPSETVGMLWATGVIFEVAFLWSLPLIEKRMSIENLVLLGAAGGTVRWFLSGFAPTNFLLWPIQAFHSVSFVAVFVGAMRMIQRDAPPAAQVSAQMVYAAFGGLFSGGVTMLSGFLYDHIHARGYWVMAAIAALGGALALAMTIHGKTAAPSPPQT